MDVPLVIHRRPTRSKAIDLRDDIYLPESMAEYCMQLHDSPANVSALLEKMVQATTDAQAPQPKRGKYCIPNDTTVV